MWRKGLTWTTPALKARRSQIQGLRPPLKAAGLLAIKDCFGGRAALRGRPAAVYDLLQSPARGAASLANRRTPATVGVRLGYSFTSASAIFWEM
jgi:hypothetical protein